MIQTSDIVAKTLCKPTRRFDAKILVGGEEIEYSVMSMNFSKGACGQFTVGTVYVPYIELVVEGDVQIDDTFEVKMSVAVHGIFEEYYQIGCYKATSHERQKSQTKIYAQGRIAETVTKVLYDEEPEIRSVYGIIEAIRNKGYTVHIKNGLEIPDAIISETKPLKGLTVREGLELVALCSGGYATEDNEGNIVLCKYAPAEPVFETNGDKQQTETTIKGSFLLTGAKIKVNENETFDIGGESKLEITNPYFNEDMVEAFTNNTVGYEFTVCTVPLSLGDFRLEPWDCIAYRDGEMPLFPADELYPHNALYPSDYLLPGQPDLSDALVPSDDLYPSSGTGIVYLVPCLTMSFSFNGGLQTNIEANGELPKEAETSKGGPLTKKVEEAYKRATESSEFKEECAVGTANVNSDCITSVPKLAEKITSIGDPDSDHISIDDSLISIYGTATRLTLGSGKVLMTYNNENILVLRAENSEQATYIDATKIRPSESKIIDLPASNIISVRVDIQLYKTIGSSTTVKYTTEPPWHGIEYEVVEDGIIVSNNYDGEYAGYGYAEINQVYITIEETGNLLEVGDNKFAINHDGKMVSLPTTEEPVSESPNLYIDEDGVIHKTEITLESLMAEIESLKSEILALK